MYTLFTNFNHISFDNYTAQDLKDAISPYKLTINNALSIFQQFLTKMVQDGSIKNFKEDILDVLSTEYTSYIIDNCYMPVESIMATILFLTFRLHDSHVEITKALKKVFQRKKYITKKDHMPICQHLYYLNICYNDQNNGYIQDLDFEKIQTCEAVDENNNSNESLVVKIFWAEGIYYEIKNYICTYKKADPSLVEILQLSLPSFTKEFKDTYADCIFNEITATAIKGDDFDHLTLPLYRVLKLFNTSKDIEDSYFFSILKTLKSEHCEEGKDELLYIMRQKEIQDYELIKISQLFDDLITNYRNEYSSIIEPLLLFLNSKEVVSYSQSLFDKVKTNISICTTLFTYIEPYFPSTIVDDTYKNGNFTSDTADFILKLLETGKYDSDQMNLIFLEFLKLRKSKYLKIIKKYSNQEKYKASIFNSLKRYIMENDIASDNITEICSLLNAFTLSEQEDRTILEKLSSTILSSLDSIEILPLFRDYTFLIINDLPSFVDFAPHNYLFYQILIEKNISNFDDVIDDIIEFDEDDACYCKSYHNFLSNAFKKTNEAKFLFKLVEITEYDDNDATTEGETNLVLSVFTHYLQNTENKREIVETIVNILQKNYDNNNLKNLLISIPNMKELINFSNPEEINTITSNLTLNDDSLAFIASIGGNVSEEQLNSLFNSSDNFYPKYIVAFLFPEELPKFSDEQKLECYRYGCLIKSYNLCKVLIESVSPLINNDDTYYECIFNTSSKIAELTIKALPELEIFSNVDHVEPFLTEMINSPQDNFELVFSAYLSKLNGGDRAICTTVWNTYFGESFPPLYRTDKNNYELFKLVSTSTSTFCDLISEIYKENYSLYRPSISLNLYQMFSNLPLLFSTIHTKSTLRIFFKLLFSYENKISETFPDMPINDFLKALTIPNQSLESVSFSNINKEFFSDTVLLIEPKGSVLNSFLQNRGNHVFLKTPDVLIIQISGKVTPDFVIDEELDLSPYCLKTTNYELSSIGCEGNVAYIKQNGTKKYLKCTKDEVTCVDKFDSNAVTLVIYEKVNNTEKYIRNETLTTFWKEESAKAVKIMNKNGAILRCLQSESIDWSLFEQNDEFFDTAIKLIKFGVENVFKSLSSSPEFSQKFFDLTEIGELFEDKNFIDKYKDEIKKLAKVYPEVPILIFWRIYENLNLNNIELFFDLFYFYDIMYDDFLNRAEIINIINEELYNTPQFEKFFVETIKMPQCNNEFIDTEIKSHPALIPLMLKVSKQEYFGLYSKLIDAKQFTSIVDEFDVEFVIYVIEQCEDKRSEFLSIAIKKLKGNPQFDEYINHLGPEKININVIKTFYLTGEIDLANSLLESKYPPQTTVKQDDIKKMLNELLIKSIQLIDKNINFSISISTLISKYYQVFENDPEVTEHLIELVYKGRQQMEQYMTDFIKLINLLPPIKWDKFLRLFINLFPLNTTYLTYRIVYKRQISLFALNAVSRIIKSCQGYVIDSLDDSKLSSVLSVLLRHIDDKKLFVDTLMPSFDHIIDDELAFPAYSRDLSHFPYLFLKIFELSVNSNCWKANYSLVFIRNVISAIKNIYNSTIPSEHIFFLNNNTKNSSADQVSISLMEFLTKQIEKVFLGPEATIKVNSQMPVNIVLNDVNDIYIEKLNDNVKRAFFKLLEKIACIYPLYAEQILHYIIKKKTINMYKRIKDESIRSEYTNFVLNLFHEIVGDHEIVQPVNDERFKKAIILLKSQFMRFLSTKNFTYEEASPYIMVFMSFFKQKNQELVKNFVNCLKPFPFVFLLLYTKDIKVDKTDNSSKINLLLMNFITKGCFDNPYPGQIIQFVKDLKHDDPQLEQKINVLSCIIKSKPMLSYQKTIIHSCFNEFEKIALKRMDDIPKIKDLFNIFILNMGLEY